MPSNTPTWGDMDPEEIRQFRIAGDVARAADEIALRFGMRRGQYSWAVEGDAMRLTLDIELHPDLSEDELERARESEPTLTPDPWWRRVRRRAF